MCRAEARIVSVTNSNIGKTVEVKGDALRDGELVIEVVASPTTDYHSAFETIDEPEYVVSLADAAAVGVLQSKEWFDWENDAMPLSGTSSPKRNLDLSTRTGARTLRLL